MIKLLATDLEPHKLPGETIVVREGEVGEPLYFFSSLSPLAVPETPVDSVPVVWGCVSNARVAPLVR